MSNINIDGFSSYAELHAKKCISIIESRGLAKALEYCTAQGIEPPQCSLTAESNNALNLRNKAKRMLSEIKWWERRLGVKENRDFESSQVQAGKVNNIVSDETLQRHANKRRT